jgi:hypothetical protein
MRRKIEAIWVVFVIVVITMICVAGVSAIIDYEFIKVKCIVIIIIVSIPINYLMMILAVIAKD